MRRRDLYRWSGFSIVEMLIAIAAILVCLAGASSWFSNYSTRAKINEALSVAEKAKTAIIVTCSENSGISELSNTKVGVEYPASPYVASVTLAGSCNLPRITVHTSNTGLRIDPMLSITGNLSIEGKDPEWSCVSTGLDVHMPEKCRG